MISLEKRPIKIVNISLLILLFLFVTCIILLGSVPPVSRDALIQHLYIPKLYLEHGKIFQIPEFSWSYYPMNLDLLYMIPLYYGNDIIPKYIHFIFALSTAFLIYYYLKKNLNRTYALLGSLYFLSIPIIIKLSITVYVDLGLIFFSTASLIFLFDWIEESFKKRWLIWAGVCCGLAIGTKYNGLLTLFILTFLVPILYIRTHDSQNRQIHVSIKGSINGFVFFLIALLFCSPWLIRNFIWTNNPFYPLFNNFFNHHQVSAHHIISLDPFSFRHVIFHESGLQILLLPLRIFFEGRDNSPQFFDGVLNPFLLLLPLCAFLRPKTFKNHPFELQKYAMLIFIVLTFMIASLEEGMRIRYISPIIPFLVILSMFGLKNIFSLVDLNQSLFKRNAINLFGLAIIVVMLGYNFNYLCKQFTIVQPISYLSGKVSRDQYISRFRPEYPIISYVNKTLPLHAKILALYLGNRGYYFNRTVEFDPEDFKCKFLSIVSQSSTPEEILLTLRKNGITYLLIRYDLFKNQAEIILNKKKQLLTEDFFQTCTQKLVSNEQYGLFRLKVVDTVK